MNASQLLWTRPVAEPQQNHAEAFLWFPPRLLDPANTLQFDDFKKCYGEILYRWGLRDKRADVLKFTSSPPEPHKGIGTFPLGSGPEPAGSGARF